MASTRSFFSAPDLDSNAVKLHVGCGGIYLRDYVNCDVQGDVRMPGDPEPAHATSADNYYAGLIGNVDKVPARRPAVVDVRCDMRELCKAAQKADKILAVQCLEHLSWTAAFEALQAWCDIVAPRGHVIISVPDAEATLDMLAGGQHTEFAVRHLVGTRTGGEYYHKSYYSHQTLKVMLRCAGFNCIEFLPNPHFYPALVVRAEI